MTSCNLVSVVFLSNFPLPGLCIFDVNIYFLANLSIVFDRMSVKLTKHAENSQDITNPIGFSSNNIIRLKKTLNLRFIKLTYNYCQ